MADVVLKVDNGWAVLPSSLKLPTNLPRFNLEFPLYLTQDAGARYLVGNEFQNGYEVPTRNLIERVLRAGDLFIDVGAHWGFFTLQAATHPAGNIRALAFEPDPANAAILYRNIVANGLSQVAQVVCAACGDAVEIAPLVSNSSMGHSIRGAGLQNVPPALHGPPKWVPVVSLDAALAYFPHAADGRVILKVDAEGLEPQVIAGARKLLDSGRVGLIVWECGQAFLDGEARLAMIHMLADLTRRGFRHLRPPGHELDGPLVPFRAEERCLTNVFSFAADVEG
jgi:FkbM family methyltransferase